jgi:hypothetical protein
MMMANEFLQEIPDLTKPLKMNPNFGTTEDSTVSPGGATLNFLHPRPTNWEDGIPRLAGQVENLLASLCASELTQDQKLIRPIHNVSICTGKVSAKILDSRNHKGTLRQCQK